MSARYGKVLEKSSSQKMYVMLANSCAVNNANDANIID